MSDVERARIIREARRIRVETEQIFTDTAYWNEHVRPPGEPPIDPDPFGDMRRLISAIDEMLANDKGHGPIAPLNFTRSQ